MKKKLFNIILFRELKYLFIIDVYHTIIIIF